MTRLSLAVLAFLVPFTSATSAQTSTSPGAAPTSVFRSGVDLVALSVTVTDPQQKYIAGLGEQDFAVFEDGVQQSLSFFATSHVLLDLAILLDTSASMTDKIDTVQEAASGFVRTLRPGDRGAVIGVNHTASIIQPFTSDVAALQAAIRGTTPSGGTALYNAVYVTLKELASLRRQNKEVRRQAIVVLSDGDDTSSLLSFDDLMEAVKRSGVSIYTIALKSKYAVMRMKAQTGRRYFSDADYAMKILAQETGGRPYAALQAPELAGVYGAIAEDLQHQYALGYASKNTRRDGTYRRVVVRVVSRPDASPRTRSGYFADTVTRMHSGGPNP